MGTFEKLGLKQVVKTTEETITIDSDNQTFRLLSENDLAPYRDIYRFMHIGLVQEEFKPLTLCGLPESFIAALHDDGLPTLFAERVGKSLRGDNTSINYEEYTYGKLISACVHEGLSLCNEIKLNQQIKRHRLNEKQQLGEFCEQFAFDIPKQKSKDKFGHYAKDCRVKEKIKSLDVDDNMKDSLYKIMLNSDSERSESDDNSSEESSTSEDLKALQQEGYMTSEDECSPCQQGLQCEKEEEEDDLYKIYSQFKELSLNVINNDDVLDLLKNIKDPEVRNQIIDKISNPITEKKRIILLKKLLPKRVHIPWQRMSLRPSWPPPSRRGRRGRTNPGRRGHIIVQHGNKQLIATNSNSSTSGTSGIDINRSMYKEFMDFMKSKKESDNNPPIYSTIRMDEANIEVFDLNDKREVILLLENSDLRWKNEPWQLMSRYLDTVSYTTTVYKYKMHYEIILSATGSSSASHTNDDDDNGACIAGEGQDADSNEEINIDALLQNYQ
ncbi:hypothetical protein H5410_050144 [Solanum commersonii]|uniref:Uncharacterized protein n=1 Tax=Solanum commersonii TaxID=4109 RepID=A0A9J5WW78_SOLCO|nr:hypothetical protein H5410_050144 [Solanum commersonii]